MTKEILEREKRITKSRAKAFITTAEEDKFWYIGGEISESAIVFDVWDDNIHEVCKWLLVNGKGLQPDMAQHLIDRHS